jgi:hypothetical protein
MADDSGEQQQLADVAAESKTRQEQVLELYNDNRVSRIALGFWLKLGIEAAIIAIPLAGLVLIPALILRQLEVLPFEYQSILGWYIVTATTLTSIAWCMTEGATSSGTTDKDS